MRAATLILALLTVSTHLHAQSGWYGYGEQSIGGSMSTFDMPSNALNNCQCPSYTGADGSALDMRIGAGYQVGNESSITFFFGASVGYTFMDMVSTLPSDSLPSLDANGNVVLSITRFSLDASFGLPNAFAEAGFRVGGVSLLVGGGLGMLVDPYYEHWLRLIEPPDAVFDPALFPEDEVEFSPDGRGVRLSHGSSGFTTDVVPLIRATTGYDAVIGGQLIGLHAMILHGFASPFEGYSGSMTTYTIGFRYTIR